MVFEFSIDALSLRKKLIFRMNFYFEVIRRSSENRLEEAKSPPVNVQMSKNSHRRSIQLDQSSKSYPSHTFYYF